MKKIGILDPLGTNKNPLTNTTYNNLYKSDPEFEFPSESKKYHKPTYKNVSKIWTNLIVYKKREEMIKAIKKHQVTLIKAGTGVGKTVLIPKFALHVTDYKEKVICCIPKKIITQETAEFAAKCLDVKLGEQVGYYYKGTRKMNENEIDTKLIFTTIGSLFSRITGDDPLLKDYKIIIIDEAHERSIQTDFTLLLIKEVLQKRKDLKLVIMSATIDLDKFRNFYKSFTFGEVDAGSETTFKIKDYVLKNPTPSWKKYVIKIILHLLNTNKKGDILVFVRSGADGRELCQQLGNEIDTKKYNPFCIELEGKSALITNKISGETNNKYATSEILYKSHPDNSKNNPFTRKVVMSTNVAESSLTVKGVVYVIDTGLEYSSKYNPDTMARSLLTEFIPQSAVKQRRGRAGRTQDGYCIHLYTKQQYKELDKYPTPEIQLTDLSPEFLDILRMEQIGDVPKLKLFLNKLIDPPSPIFVNNGLHILESLGAVKDNKITVLGQMISKFRGIKPMYSKSIIYSHFYECKRDIIDIISLITILKGKIEDLYKVRNKVVIDKKFVSHNSDHLTLLKTYQQFHEYQYGDTPHNGAEVFRWCMNHHVNHKILTDTNKLARDTTQVLNKCIKDNPEFKPDDLKNVSDTDLKILYCLTHKMNVAKFTRNSNYKTVFPDRKIDAQLNKVHTLQKMGNYILFDELFQSAGGFKYQVVSNLSSI